MLFDGNGQQQFGNFGFNGFNGTIPAGTGFQYQGASVGTVNNILSAEEIAQLMKQENTFSLALTQVEALRAQCTHRSQDGTRDMLVYNDETGKVKCQICGYEFNPLDHTTSKESIQASVDEIVDVLQTIKLIWIDITPEPAKEFFQIIGLLEKVPQLFEIAAKNFAKHNPNAAWQYSNANMSTLNLFSMLSGIINGQPMAQPMGQQPYGMNMGQPMGNMGMGMQQPQAPFGMPASNGFGYVGNTPMGYQPNTTGFSTQYGAPVQQAPVADVQATPVATTTADAAATKA